MYVSKIELTALIKDTAASIAVEKYVKFLFSKKQRYFLFFRNDIQEIRFRVLFACLFQDSNNPQFI